MDVVDDFGLTPLHRAAYNGHLDIAEVSLPPSLHCSLCVYVACSIPQILINAGAPIDVADAGGETPLQDATWNGHIAIARVRIHY